MSSVAHSGLVGEGTYTEYCKGLVASDEEVMDFFVRVVKQWNKLPNLTVFSPSATVFKLQFDHNWSTIFPQLPMQFVFL